MNYDVIIIGGGPGGIFSAYELIQRKPEVKVAVFEAGHALDKRHCPIDGENIKTCIGCKSCSIMSGFGGAGAFSDGKLSLSPDVGGYLPEILGYEKTMELIENRTGEPLSFVNYERGIEVMLAKREAVNKAIEENL